MEHPNAEELRRFAAGTATRREGRKIVAHLLAGCAACQVAVRSFAGSAPLGEAPYHAVFQRLEARAALSAADGRDGRESRKFDAQALFRELEPLSRIRQSMLLRNSDRFLSSELAQLLLEKSHSFRYNDPLEMLHWARLAAQIADRLSAQDLDRKERHADLAATCYAQLCHALRVSGDLAAAEGALSEAHAALRRGTGNPLARALVYESLGSLRMAQLRCFEAIHSYSTAVEIYRHLGRTDALGRALVGQAIATGESGQPQEALELLLEAMPKIESDPRSTLAACHAVVRFLIDSGKIDEATCRWIDLRPFYDKLNDPLITLRAAWLEGLLLKGGGRYSASLKMLETAHCGFQQRDLGWEGALVSLDMAECYLHLGLTRKLRQALAEVNSLVREHDVDRQALVALISLQSHLGVALSAGDPPPELQPT